MRSKALFFVVVPALSSSSAAAAAAASYATPPSIAIDPLARRHRSASATTTKRGTTRLLSVRSSSSSSSSPRVVVRPPRSEEEEGGTTGSTTPWSDFKDVTYDIADAAASLLRRAKETTEGQKAQRRRPPTIVAAGYGDASSSAIENPPPPYDAVETEIAETPGGRLLRRYEAATKRGDAAARRSRRPSAVVVPGVEPGRERRIATGRARAVADAYDADDDDYFRSEPRKAFDSVKDGLYGTFDSIVDLFSAAAENREDRSRNARSPARNLTGEAATRRRRRPTTTTTLDRSSSMSTSSVVVPPVAKPSANDDVESRAVRFLLPRLSSTNPIVKFRAEMELRSIEKRREARETTRKRREALEAAKDAIYGVADGVKNAIDAASTVPGKARDAAVATVETAGSAAEVLASVPGTVGSTIATTAETVRSAPRTARETIEGVRTGVGDAVRTSRKVLEDVRSVPSNVKRTVAETKRTLDAVGSTVEDVAYNAKVLVGAEKPKPPPPPPKPTAEDVVKKWAWRGTTGAAKAAWFLGKNAVVWGGKGLLAGWDLATSTASGETAVDKRRGTTGEESSQRARLEDKLGKRRRTSAEGSDLPKPNLVSTIDDVDADLGKEVSDALRLAKEALAMPAANVGGGGGDAASTTDADAKALARTEREIDEALRRARTAAFAAANDAMEVEELLKKKMGG